MKTLTASIVTFNNPESVLSQAIKSALSSNVLDKLFIVDNSPNDKLRSFCEGLNDSRIEYIFNSANLGFGKAHNIAIKRSLQEGFQYHVVLNPDVFFEKEVLNSIVNFMNSQPQIAQLMPKILYPSGAVQHLCKLLPSPLDLLLRRLLGNSEIVKKRNEIYELRFADYDKLMNIPYLSGCFMFFRNSALKEVGLFDENIFMYIEDCDITRRLHKKFQTLYWPEVSIFHHYAKGSYKNWRLLLYNIHGAMIYFNKYGWFFDKEREAINKKVLQSLSL
jgi:GT2 family glycosyltransferase